MATSSLKVIPTAANLLVDTTIAGILPYPVHKDPCEQQQQQ